MSEVEAKFVRWFLTWAFIISVVASILEWCRDNWQLLLGIAAIPTTLFFSIAVLKSLKRGKEVKALWKGENDSMRPR